MSNFKTEWQNKLKKGLFLKELSERKIMFTMTWHINLTPYNGRPTT